MVHPNPRAVGPFEVGLDTARHSDWTLYRTNNESRVSVEPYLTKTFVNFSQKQGPWLCATPEVKWTAEYKSKSPWIVKYLNLLNKSDIYDAKG